MAEVKMVDDIEDTSSEDEVENEDNAIEPPQYAEEVEEVIRSVQDVDPETEIWTGGPKAGKVIEWMEQYKKVYTTSFDWDDHVVWRPLKRREQAQITNHLESLPQEMTEMEINMVNEELICKTCVLYPDFSNQDFDDLLAGIPTLIAQQILERSGFTAIAMREMI